ncbi:hypothetical protein ACT6NV_13935 [Robiginitalea sp. IMCC44478]|uniref:hypothetical protein n=1 Tax=Robiginitalea sp. IMCC44478 TaxID=3459122 RepID=UPI00404177A5
MKYTVLTYQLLPLLELPVLETGLLWKLCILFSGIAGLYFLLIFRLRNRISARKEAIIQQKRMLAPMISNFLFYEQQADREEQEEYIRMKIEIRELLKDPLNREVITEVLMDLKMDVSGDARKKLLELYVNLGLQQDAFEMLKSRRWERISKGINQLAEMQVVESYIFIRKFINHRRGTIRKQAQLATVSLKEEGIEYFLDKARYQISEWQQLKLLEILRQKQDYIPPKFNNWLTSENKDVVLFSLRLIRHYRQSEAEESIITLLRHRSSTIKYAALECIRDFGFIKARPHLKILFKRSGEELKLLILDVLAQFGNSEDVVFLKEKAAKDWNFVVRSKALSAINTIIPGAILPQNDLEKGFPTVDAEPTEQENADLNASTNAQQASVPAMDEELLQEQKPENIQEGPRVASGAEDTKEVSEAEQPNENEEQPNQTDPIAAQVAAQNPQPWDIEDETIFDQCFLEELKDILSSTEDDPNQRELPLEFLPLVTHNINPTPMKPSNKPADHNHLMQIEVMDPLVVEPDNYNEQLRETLSGDYPELAEIFDLSFIPWITNNPETPSADEETQPEPVSEHEKAEEALIEAETAEEIPYKEFSEAQPAESAGKEQEEKQPADSGRTADSAMDDISVVPSENTAGNADELEHVAVPSEKVTEPSEEPAVPLDLIEEPSLAEEVETDSEPAEQEMPHFSIFQEYFRNYDTESKLIMLDEIPAIGEWKELLFLQTLFRDPNPKIARKARLVSQQLQKNLEGQLQEQTTSSESAKVPEKSVAAGKTKDKPFGKKRILQPRTTGSRQFISGGHLDFTPHFDQTVALSNSREGYTSKRNKKHKKRLQKNIDWPLT